MSSKPRALMVPTDGSFRLKHCKTKPPKNAPDKEACTKKLAEYVKEIGELQEKLYASDRHSILLIFQAMDAAGKDGTIRALLTGVNPVGCQVYSFKKPSDEELDHDFLWRMHKALPERGRIGVWNRSHYEEVLVVRVHEGILQSQRLPEENMGKKLWEHRFESIEGFERHLARNGTVILKFFLHVSPEVQKQRLTDRLEEKGSQWKAALTDVHERAHWKKYMSAYEDALSRTSKPWAPWYVIPADDKPFMRMSVAHIVAERLRELDLEFPKVNKEKAREIVEAKRLLSGSEER